MATTGTRSSAQPAIPYRVRDRRAVLLQAGLFLLLVLGVVVAIVSTDAPSTVEGLAFAAVLTVSGAVTWRLGAKSVTVEHDHIVVTNAFRRHRIAWEDLGEFRPVRVDVPIPVGVYDTYWVMSVSTGPDSAVTLRVLTANERGPTRWSGQIVRRLEAHRDAVLAGRSPDEVHGVLPPIRRYLR